MTPTLPGYWTVVGRALRLRCPRCGEGRLFVKRFAMAPACPSCGLDFCPEPGYYVGAMYINYGLTAVVMMGAGVPLAHYVPMERLNAPLAAWAILFPIAFFRHSRGLWLGLQWLSESRMQG